VSGTSLHEVDVDKLQKFSGHAVEVGSWIPPNSSC
jgi:hypothetical protein